MWTSLIIAWQIFAASPTEAVFHEGEVYVLSAPETFACSANILGLDKSDPEWIRYGLIRASTLPPTGQRLWLQNDNQVIAGRVLAVRLDSARGGHTACHGPFPNTAVVYFDENIPWQERTFGGMPTKLSAVAFTKKLQLEGLGSADFAALHASYAEMVSLTDLNNDNVWEIVFRDWNSDCSLSAGHFTEDRPYPHDTYCLSSDQPMALRMREKAPVNLAVAGPEQDNAAPTRWLIQGAARSRLGDRVCILDAGNKWVPGKLERWLPATEAQDRCSTLPCASVSLARGAARPQDGFYRLALQGACPMGRKRLKVERRSASFQSGATTQIYQKLQATTPHGLSLETVDEHQFTLNGLSVQFFIAHPSSQQQQAYDQVIVSAVWKARGQTPQVLPGVLDILAVSDVDGDGIVEVLMLTNGGKYSGNYVIRRFGKSGFIGEPTILASFGC